MSLPDAPAAAELIEFLRANDHQYPVLPLTDETYESMEGWTEDECREVVEAAQRNTSVTWLSVDVSNWRTKTERFVPTMLAKLSHVRRVELYDWELEDGPAAPPSRADQILGAVSRSPSKKVRVLDLSVLCSPRALAKFARRFPDLHQVRYWDRTIPNPDWLAGPERMIDDDRRRFLAEMTRTVPRLRSLSTAVLQFEVAHAGALALMASLRRSKLRHVELEFWRKPNLDIGDLIREAGSFCARTKRLKTVLFRGKTASVDGVVDMSRLFDGATAFSPTVKRVTFESSWLGDSRGGNVVVARVVKALENVEVLRFDRCECPFAVKIVEGLPRLRELSFVSRSRAEDVPDDPSLDPDDVEDDNDDNLSLLATNAQLAALCRVVGREGSLLEDIELDVQGSDKSFPALARLLPACKGRLSLRMAFLPRTSSAHIVRGVEHLRPDLVELWLHFSYCHLVDQDYADIFHALRSNGTIRTFRFAFTRDPGPLTRAAIRDLLEVHPRIKTLNVTVYELTGAVAILLESIVPALKSTNRQIRTLGLHGADLNDEWPRLRGPMLDMLQENRILSFLTGLELPNSDPVAFTIKQNWYGRQFLRSDQSGSSVPLWVWPRILAEITLDGEFSVMYKFLRSKPDLVSGPCHPPSSQNRGDEAGRGGRKRRWVAG